MQRYLMENYNSTCFDSMIEDKRYEFLDPLRQDLNENY